MASIIACRNVANGFRNGMGFVVLTVFLTLGPGTADADQIDGEWCYRDGRGVSIHGPQIITPGGNKLQGEYDRHGFTYIIPTGETGAGGRMVMLQQDDNTIHVWRKGDTTAEAGAAEIWHRCDRKTS